MVSLDAGGRVQCVYDSLRMVGGKGEVGNAGDAYGNGWVTFRVEIHERIIMTAVQDGGVEKLIFTGGARSPHFTIL